MAEKQRIVGIDLGTTNTLVASVKNRVAKVVPGERGNLIIPSVVALSAKGDLLVIRSNFTIKRADFGINPGAPQDKVSNEIELSLNIAGAAGCHYEYIHEREAPRLMELGHDVAFPH